MWFNKVKKKNNKNKNAMGHATYTTNIKFEINAF